MTTPSTPDDRDVPGNCAAVTDIRTAMLPADDVHIDALATMLRQARHLSSDAATASLRVRSAIEDLHRIRRSDERNSAEAKRALADAARAIVSPYSAAFGTQHARAVNWVTT